MRDVALAEHMLDPRVPLAGPGRVHPGQLKRAGRVAKAREGERRFRPLDEAQRDRCAERIALARAEGQIGRLADARERRQGRGRSKASASKQTSKGSPMGGWGFRPQPDRGGAPSGTNL
jgi:hypothetical protein